jgi:hypothetical protein
MTEYGVKVGAALKAVLQLHTDTSKLLVDFDKKMSGYSSVFGNFATSELTYHVRAEGWMASGVYRYYTKDKMPGLVDGIMVCFLDSRLEEPMLLVAELKYHLESGADIRQVCKPWDIWYLYFDWSSSTGDQEIIANADTDHGRIEWSKVKAVPLYTIHQIEDVKEILDEVRGSTVAA